MNPNTQRPQNSNNSTNPTSSRIPHLDKTTPSKWEKSTPNRIVQSLTERLGFMARLPQQYRKKEVLSKNTSGTSQLFQEKMSGKKESAKKQDKKDIKIQKQQEYLPARVQPMRRQGSSASRRKNQSHQILQNNAIFEKEKQSYEQLKANIDFVEQSFSNSRVTTQNELKYLSKPNDKQQFDYLKPQFLHLLALFKKTLLKRQQSKEAAILFLKWQIESFLGHKCSRIYQPDDMHFLDQKDLQNILAVKISESKVLNHILDAYYIFLSDLFSKAEVEQSIRSITYQIWIFFIEYYHQKAQQLLAVSYVFFYEKQKRCQNADQEERLNEFIVMKMEQLNKGSINIDENADWAKLFQSQLSCGDFESPMGRHKQRKSSQVPYQILLRLQSPQLEQLQRINPKKYKSQSSFIHLRQRFDVPKQWLQGISIKKQSPKLPSFNPFDLSSDLNLQSQMLLLKYSVVIDWFKSRQQKTADFSYSLKDVGKVNFSLLTTYQDLAVLLKDQVTKKLRYVLRVDAEFKYSKLFETKEPEVFQIDIIVSQRIVNIPPEYTWSAVWRDRFIVSSLKIQNQFGQAAWDQQINLSKVDFGRQAFKIVNLTVQCECEELNRPCLVTFYDLPSDLKEISIDNEECIDHFADFIERENNAILQQVRMEQGSFTVRFFNFNNRQRDMAKSINAHKFENAQPNDL